MTRSTVAEAAEPVASPSQHPDDEALTLEQFGTTQSARDKRVELLNAFLATERAAGRYAAPLKQWQDAYRAFAVRPV